ncbi:protein of unknown function [Paraburkholderia kururiensis]
MEMGRHRQRPRKTGAPFASAKIGDGKTQAGRVAMGDARVGSVANPASLVRRTMPSAETTPASVRAHANLGAEPPAPTCAADHEHR